MSDDGLADALRVATEQDGLNRALAQATADDQARRAQDAGLNAALALVTVADQQGFRNGRTKLPGTVISYSYPIATVAVDGGGDAIGIASLIGDVTAGDRVMVEFQPPRGVFVVGRITPEGVVGPRPWIRLTGTSITVTENVPTYATWASVAAVGGGLPSSAWWTSGDYVTFPQLGIYMVSWGGTWAGQAGGYREARLMADVAGGGYLSVKSDDRWAGQATAMQNTASWPLMVVTLPTTIGVRFYYPSGVVGTLGLSGIQVRITYVDDLNL